MRYGNPIHDPVCGRCKQSMQIAMLKEGVYQDGLWFHSACHREGADQLYRAMRLAHGLTDGQQGIALIPSSRLQAHESFGWYTE
jgi:hypothetical protein